MRLQNGLPYYHNCLCPNMDGHLESIDPGGSLLAALHPNNVKLAGCVSQIAVARSGASEVTCTSRPERTLFRFGAVKQSDATQLDALIELMCGAGIAASRVRAILPTCILDDS